MPIPSLRRFGITVLARHNAVRRSALAKHLSEVARKRIGLLERSEVATLFVARLEDNLADRVCPSRHENVSDMHGMMGGSGGGGRTGQAA